MNFIEQGCLFDVLVGYYLREHQRKSCVSSTLLSYISRLKSRRKLPPKKEKNGLRLAARRCDVEWVPSPTIDACRVSVTLSKHRLCNDQRFISCFVRTVVRSSQASRLDIQRLLLVKHPQTPLVFNNSFASKGEQQ